MSRSARRQADRAARYERRLTAGVCTWPRTHDCMQPLRDGSSMCAEHAAAQAAYVAKSRDARRTGLRAKGLCTECGRNKTKQWRCAPCAIRLGYAQVPVELRIGKDIVKKPGSVTSTHSARIAAATHRVTEGDGRARIRHRGRGRRGGVGNAGNDEFDARLAQQELESAIAALVHAHSPLVKAKPRLQARDILHAALSRVHLVQRLLGVILARHKYG